MEFNLDHQASKDTPKKPKKNVPWTSQKNQKKKKFFQNYSSNCPSGAKSADLIKRLQIFRRKIRHFFAENKSEFVSQSHHIVFVKVFLWTCKCLFDNFVEKFRQSWKKLCSNSILNWKKAFWKNKSTKSYRTFRMQLWRIWRNLFSELRFIFARTRS